MRTTPWISCLLLAASMAQAQESQDFVFPDGFEALQAMRIQSLELRDPHLFASLIGQCIDVTSTVNAELASTLNADADQDGYLDNSAMLLFRPLHTNGRQGLGRIGGARCTAPATGTSCEADTAATGPMPYQSLAVGTCLAPIPGTIQPYTPAVGESVGPCFAGDQVEIDFDLGLPLPLQDVRIGGTRRDNPTPGVGNGLLYGFLTETAADAILIDLSLFGQHTLSSLLPGGPGNCSELNDMDTHEGESGWWFYLNYDADQVPFAETGQ